MSCFTVLLAVAFFGGQFVSRTITGGSTFPSAVVSEVSTARADVAQCSLTKSVAVRATVSRALSRCRMTGDWIFTRATLNTPASHWSFLATTADLVEVAYDFGSGHLGRAPPAV